MPPEGARGRHTASPSGQAPSAATGRVIPTRAAAAARPSARAERVPQWKKRPASRPQSHGISGLDRAGWRVTSL